MTRRNRGITIKDVAQTAGVSTATVSRVINKDPKVTEKNRELVLAAMKETGYRLNPIARSLRAQKTHTIGIVAPEFQNDFFTAVAEGIERVLRQRGYTTFILNSREDIIEEKARLEMLAEKQVDGAIIIPASGIGSHFSYLTEHGIPFVMVDRMIEGMQADCVLTDNVHGAYEAVSACIADGAASVAVIAGDQSLTSARERYEGYLKALKAHDIAIDGSMIEFGDMHITSGYEAMKRITEQHPSLTHVFIVNLFMRIGAEKYLAEHQEFSEVKIAAFDEAAISSLFTHSFITVKQPLEEIGTTAAGLLLKRIDKEELPFPQVYRLKAELS